MSVLMLRLQIIQEYNIKNPVSSCNGFDISVLVAQAQAK